MDQQSEAAGDAVTDGAARGEGTVGVSKTGTDANSVGYITISVVVSLAAIVCLIAAAHNRTQRLHQQHQERGATGGIISGENVEYGAPTVVQNTVFIREQTEQQGQRRCGANYTWPAGSYEDEAGGSSSTIIHAIPMVAGGDSSTALSPLASASNSIV
jgi:hypothetical protein